MSLLPVIMVVAMVGGPLPTPVVLGAAQTGTTKTPNGSPLTLLGCGGSPYTSGTGGSIGTSSAPRIKPPKKSP